MSFSSDTPNTAGTASEAPEAVISVKDVSKFFEIYEKPSHRLWQMLCRGGKQFYRPFWALADISFEMARGECVGIIGRNGAGKSTLLQIITGTLSPSSGSIETKGRVAALLELGSGFNPEFTGRENVYLNAAILGLRKEEVEAKFDEIVAFADIGEFIEQPVKSYSSGMVVRLAFAVVAHVDADVLIIDEALAVGDTFFTQKCMRFLRRFMETNTVLFVSHDVAAVNSLCNRAILLENGRVKLMGSPKDVTEVYLEDMFESMQGKSVQPRSEKSDRSVSSGNGSLLLPAGEEDFRDMRQDMLVQSSLRNDIQVFRFDENGAAFGKGGASIVQVMLVNQDEQPLNWIVGGEVATLRIVCQAHEELFSPIIGFHLKDRLGQCVFGDNTYLAFSDAPLHVRPGQHIKASFTFRVPVLAAGDYSFAVAVAEGTQADHVQHQWRHDALFLTSVATSASAGIMGIPMKSITLEARNTDTTQPTEAL